MSFMDMFRQTQEISAQPQDQNQTQPKNPSVAGVNLPAQVEKMPGSDQTPPNPLDVYSKMWENANKASEAPPAFALDPKVVNDVSANLDFTKGISPEVMQKALSGDTQALMEAINQAGRAAYTTSLTHTSALTDKFISARHEFDSRNVGAQVRNELTASALANTPNYNHPVVKKELNRIASAMAIDNPDASPEQIAKAASKYIQEFANAISPPAAPSPEATSGETDWAKYLG